MSVPSLNEADAERLARLLKALAEPSRLRLLSLLGGSEEGELCVCDLTAPLGLSQPTISHHLKILLDVGLVQRETRGKWRFYRVTPEGLTAVASLFSSDLMAAEV
jgi:ArsR family transcriptional regulator, arsenate/arsenite/antimonite-responsive transcriptional repressor